MSVTLTRSSTQIIRPAKNILGSLRLPGDKSISHRYAMLAGLAEGTTKLANFSTGADCASSLGCVEALGARVLLKGNGDVEVTGVGGAFLAPAKLLDCGNSGSTMRMMSGLLAAHPHTFTLIGDESLSRRPMERIRKPLAAMGARIDLTDGHAPVIIHGGPLTGLDYATPMASAQVKTALLFAGFQARGTTVVHESIPTRDHGELALRSFGVELVRSSGRIEVRGGQRLRALAATVPGDMSSAAFFLCAAVLFPASNLVLDQIGMNPTRAALLDVLTSLGASFKLLNLQEQHGELIGTIQVKPPTDGLLGATLSGSQSAQLIDELPVLAAIAPYSRNGIRIRDAKELRVKESDRIALVAQNLRAMGAEVTEVEDGLDVPGGQQLHGAEIDSGGDHRIAMAFSVAALRAEGESRIHGADAAAISFPEFYTLLDSICER